MESTETALRRLTADGSDGDFYGDFYGGLNSKKANDDYTYKKKLIAIWSAIKAI